MRTVELENDATTLRINLAMATQAVSDFTLKLASQTADHQREVDSAKQALDEQKKDAEHAAALKEKDYRDALKEAQRESEKAAALVATHHQAELQICRLLPLLRVNPTRNQPLLLLSGREISLIPYPHSADGN